MIEDDKSESEEDFRNRWESLLSDADISSIPVNYLKSVEISMVDGSIEQFDINELLSKGLTHSEIETMMEEFMDQFDDNIESLDFHLNLEVLAEEVGNKTKRLIG